MEVTFPKFASIRELLDYPSPGLRPEEAKLREEASAAIYELEKLNTKIFNTSTDMLVEIISMAGDTFDEYDQYLESIRDKLMSGDFQPAALAVEIEWFLSGREAPSVPDKQVA